MGPFKTMNGKYSLVLVDYFSKWCEVEFVRDITMIRVIKFLHNVFVREGYSNHIVMDNGEFVKNCDNVISIKGR